MKKIITTLSLLFLSFGFSYGAMWSAGDNLGDHKATRMLDMNGYTIENSRGIQTSSITFMGGNTTGDYYISQNTLALWRFDEGSGTIINDSSGNNNNGTIIGSGHSWNTTTTRFSGAALKLSGANNYVLTTNFPMLQRSSFTISAWVRIDEDVSGTDTLIAKAGTSSTKSWWLATNHNSNKLNFSYSTDGINSSFSPANSMNSALPLGIWTMITITYDGTYTRYYMDDWLDKKVIQSISGQLFHTNTSSVTIGCLYSYDTPTNFWAGQIDSLVIENNVWTAEKVREQFYSGGAKYNRLTNTVVPYKNYIVFEASSTVLGDDNVADMHNAKLGVWNNHPGIFGTNFFVRAPYGRLRLNDPGFVAINVGVLDKGENGVIGEGGSVDLRWVIGANASSGYPAITWIGGGTLYLLGNVAIISNLNVGSNVITQSSVTTPSLRVSSVTFTDGVVNTGRLLKVKNTSGTILNEVVYHSTSTVTIPSNSTYTVILPASVNEIVNIGLTQKGANSIDCFINDVFTSSFTIVNNNLINQVVFWQAYVRE